MALHKMLLFINTILCLTYTSTLAGYDKPPILRNFKIGECLGTWYQQSGSERCDNCCIIRTLTLLRPGLLNITDVIKKPSTSTPTIRTVLVKKDPETQKYRSGFSETWIPVAGNCKGVIMKQVNSSKMEFFSREIHPKAWLEAPDYNITMHKYNAEEACAKYV